jgi:hypothetical protein
MEYGILIGAAVHLFLLAYMAGGRPHPELIREPVNAFFLLSHAQQFAIFIHKYLRISNRVVRRPKEESSLKLTQTFTSLE